MVLPHDVSNGAQRAQCRTRVAAVPEKIVLDLATTNACAEPTNVLPGTKQAPSRLVRSVTLRSGLVLFQRGGRQDGLRSTCRGRVSCRSLGPWLPATPLVPARRFDGRKE